jgi:hypothetical protein
MEEIVLVTGAHLTRSWTNIAFLEGQIDARVSFEAQVVTDTSINRHVSPDCIIEAVLNHSPIGEIATRDETHARNAITVARLMRLVGDFVCMFLTSPLPPSSNDASRQDCISKGHVGRVSRWKIGTHGGITLEKVKVIGAIHVSPGTWIHLTTQPICDLKAHCLCPKRTFGPWGPAPTPQERLVMIK